MSAYVTDRELADWVRTKLEKKTQKALAQHIGVSEAYLSDFLNGRRNAGPTILKGLGYDPTPHYRRQKAEKARTSVDTRTLFDD